MSLAPPRGSQLVVVGIADVKVSANPEETLITYALGSCLGVTIYDPVAKVGGLLHAMLPSGKANPERAQENPARFVDSGLPVLFKSAYALGAQKERIVVRVAGGAHMASAGGREDGFQIGKRNFVELKRMLWKNGVLLEDQDVGGSISRTISMSIETGDVWVKSGGEDYLLRRHFPRRPAAQE